MLLFLMTSVGVIDTQLLNQYETVVESKDFIPSGYSPSSQKTKDGREHGEAVVSTIEDASEKKLKIYHANVFVNTPTGLATSWSRAKQALDWFKSKNITYVCTNFVLDKNKDVEDFVGYANSLGLKLVTTIGDDNDNLTTGVPYPASDSRVIATEATDYKIRKLIPNRVRQLAKHSESGIAPRDVYSKTEDEVIGSSFAAARACAKLALVNPS